jgi:hypothetical protein
MHTLTKENIIEFQEKGYTVLVEGNLLLYKLGHELTRP